MAEPTPPKGPPPTEIRSLLIGNEIALLEVLLYLHDKGLIDKDDLAARLDWGADNAERQIKEHGRDGAPITFQTRYLAYALRASELVGGNGDQT